jgi:hypothetical protein
VGLYQLAERAKEADAVLRIALSGVRAEVRDEIRMETKYVKIGERQEWDEKKKKNVTKDVYGNRDEPASWRIADGSLSASVEVALAGQGAPRTSDVGTSYHNQFKIESGVPPEAATEESLRRFMVAAAADNAIAQVTFSPDPLEALLAVNDELKAGNRLAQSGLFQEALDEWSRRTYKGGTEAARIHNVGVAHEALAYKLPPYSPEHREHLQQAKEHYLKALQLDPGEKYFRDPPPRIDQSLAYAASAALFAQELESFREERAERPAREEPRARGEAPARARPASATTAGPLRNGSFESAGTPWTVSGKGAVVQEGSARGRVFELVPAGTASADLRQAVDVAIPGTGGASLAFDYRVVSGEARIRAMIGYADASGRSRTSTIEVSGGEGPGAWSPWTGDVAALRPRPSAIKEVRIVVEGGAVRLDNVALTVR